jgi:hypothetical protein
VYRRISETSFRNNECGTLRALVLSSDPNNRKSFTLMCPFYDVSDVSMLTEDERLQHGMGCVIVVAFARRAAPRVGSRTSVSNAALLTLTASLLLERRFVAMTFQPSRLTATAAFLAASEDLVIVLEDSAMLTGSTPTGGGGVDDSITMDTSPTIVAMMGLTRGVVNNVDEAELPALFKKAGSFVTFEVRARR